MSNTKIKAAQFHGVVGHGTDGYFLMTNADGSMSWAEGGASGPSVTSVAYPGDDTAADPAGGQTVVLTGTNFGSSMSVTIGGTAAPSVAHDSSTQLTITTPAKAAGDYDIVVTNTVTGTSGTFVNGISYNGIPTWTTAAGSLGTFESETTISTITLAATEPDGGTITFNITNGALPTGLSLTGANIDGTTTAESSTTLYSFTIEAIDDENQSTPRNFSITVNSAEIVSSENFTINTYTGNGSTQSIEGKIGTAASFNGSTSHIDIPSTIPYTNTDFTFSCWFNLSSAFSSGFQTIIGAGDKSTGEGIIRVLLRYSSANNYTIEPVRAYSGNSYYTATSNYSAQTINAGTWYHLSYTYSATGNTAKIYLNGSLVSTTNLTTTSTDATNTGVLALGQYRDSNSSTNWNGKIDQVRFFNIAITDSAKISQLAAENNTSSTKSTTDIFDDGSGVALYEFEKGAIDTGGNIGSLYTTNRELDLDVDGYTSGTVSDLSGNSYTATLNGNTTYGTDSNGGGYFDFDGTGDYLSVDQTIASSFSGDFTLEFIIEPHEATNFTYVYAKQNASTNGLVIGNFGSPSSDIEIYRQNTSGTSTINGTITSTGITQDEWQHIAIVFSGANATLYRNGSEKGTITGSAATYPTDFTEFYIGGNYSGSFDLNGRVGDFRIHSSALSDSQILQNFNASKGSYGVGYDGTPTNVNFLGMAFAPDFVWIKDRGTAESHQLFDSLRGAGEVIESDDDSGEVTRSDSLTSFDNNGFTLGADGAGFVNYVGRGPYIAWCWKAGGTAVSNTDGTITSQVSANTDAGFSVVKYTGDGSGNNTSTTVGHGLSSAPELVIAKILDTSGSWQIQYAKDSDNLAGSFTSGAFINHSAVVPTSTVFNPYYANTSNNFITYCFHSVDGYQKIGSYQGDGGSDNQIDLGFQPRFLMVKLTSHSGQNWYIMDDLRENTSVEKALSANTNGIEDSLSNHLDFTSTGFTLTKNSTAFNQSGYTYIYLAIA